MSSDADAATAAAVTALDSLSTELYCALAAAVLFIYDAFITFDQEVACVWTAKRTGASILFFANKWISITVSVMALVEFATFPSDKFVPGAVFSALRAYVLSKSKPLGLLVLALSLAPVGSNLVPYGYQLSGENFPPFGCMEMDDTTEALNFRFDSRYHDPILMVLTLYQAVPLLIADILLIHITWTKLSSQWGTLRDIQQSRRLSLSDTFFRGGTIYFIVMFILNVLHLVFSLTALAGTSDTGVSDVTAFTSPITAILISRFLLELQGASQTVVRLDPDDPLHSSRDPYDTPNFISSLGGIINPDLPASSDDTFELNNGSRSERREEGSA
ncbi:hypothetical protein C8T65DRAFT_736674 [Cerioporus squamosus]|nr:hypothetical protein C8T65DRAFT_736674 [Cerioporus squamosus]